MADARRRRACWRPERGCRGTPDLIERWSQLRLDTTMVFTPFVDETMPFPPAHQHRLQQLGDRILFGSDFPNIPYSYADAMRSITRLPGVDDNWLRAVFYKNAATLFDCS
ncbi:MAG: amidohydrolase family protein [Mycobacterium sp.]|nr:amidohydrolase family protein [Mycobacterium sp.]